jgi:hypothetical protein
MIMVKELVTDLSVPYNLNQPKQVDKKTGKTKRTKKKGQEKQEEPKPRDPLQSYIQISVEKFLFTKIYEPLFQMYTCKYSTQNDLFLERSYNIKILKQEDVMRNLDIKERYIFGESL